jgi:histidyl-tRNA synthetase
MLTQRPRGTADILPQDTVLWQFFEQQARAVFATYHFAEIRTPVFEHTELFERGVGDTTDIVSKEMYTFTDRSNRSVTLRPEGTAGVVRAYVENKLYGLPDVQKLYYMGPMFRYEKPQKGRYRQFHQYGCEVLGSDNPALDAEVIALNLAVLKAVGATDLSIELNSVGCSVCRPLHKERMIAALSPYRAELCKDCQSRLDKNPLRIFDCKNAHCQAVLAKSGAPTIIESLCEDCEHHLGQVKRFLDVLQVPYTINDRLVRGLDYYTRTAWEVVSESFGALCGGGRYNGLVAEVGGPETPGIGFAGGTERILLYLEEKGLAEQTDGQLEVYVAVAGKEAEDAAARLLMTLRQAGIRADRDYAGKGLKAQLKAADRTGATAVLLLGEDELRENTVSVKQLATGEQTSVGRTELLTHLKEMGISR